MNNLVVLSQEVSEALKHNKPVVALESTIISHGMPYPQNKEVALNCEKIIRDNGCVPATIAILDGKMCVGLTEEQIDYLARTGSGVFKVSRRDIPYVVSKKIPGATTVATTMYIASLAGVKVFATGGIGGVHRGYNESMDVSADLEELAMTDVCVICAGAKAILDLPRTLEYLETKGVMVIGYQTSKLPCFYTRTSEYDVPVRMDTPKEIADFLVAKHECGLHGGTLVCNPIPEQYSLDEKIMNEAIDKAIRKMNEEHIVGKATTPFLLKEIVAITGGKSLEANINLVFNNVKLACEIAKNL